MWDGYQAVYRYGGGVSIHVDSPAHKCGGDLPSPCQAGDGRTPSVGRPYACLCRLLQGGVGTPPLLEDAGDRSSLLLEPLGSASALPLPLCSLRAPSSNSPTSPTLSAWISCAHWARGHLQVRDCLFFGSPTCQPHQDLQVLCVLTLVFFFVSLFTFEWGLFQRHRGSPTSDIHTSQRAAWSPPHHRALSGCCTRTHVRWCT